MYTINDVIARIRAGTATASDADKIEDYIYQLRSLITAERSMATGLRDELDQISHPGCSCPG
ncbi:hypothetical protein LH435_13670 [Laribacter hongkongensis]|uniref:hypothetical protein n=1 Tax=Laribacter hongkongensis TaxID=168471 RepID=UPI001EFDB4DC|nr:hypothetical protein [Laribacter hongkongensis]MCG8995592.1 hypothetical protein [Laribacter hongkongensis]MCG9009324.1 hypothetical protein [Laribacter hongkongensis]MCG9022649.1 hypothetical protein [Laribacter hongkongensis]MCG9045610.1 hypothetical protein [Laribacter hongkongensis]MCG9075036.1 hypothetical protein [Laribacter hongkongensis]